MSVASELQRIQTAKENIRTAINNKGGSVSSNDLIDTYATAIDNLPVGPSPTPPQPVSPIPTDEVRYIQNDSGAMPVNLDTMGWDSQILVMLDTNQYDSTLGLFVAKFDGDIDQVPQNQFRGEYQLLSVELPSGITQIGDDSFSDCQELREVKIFATTPPTLGMNVFYKNSQPNTDITFLVPQGCGAAYQTAWPDFANQIEEMTSITTTMKYDTYSGALLGLPVTGWLSSLVAQPLALSNDIVNGQPTAAFNTNISKIADYAFMGSDVNDITIPNTVVEIGDSAFSGCQSLGAIDLPSSLVIIGDNAFSGTMLTDITIPSNVTSIGESAFAGCQNLYDVTVLATTPPTLGSYTFQGSPVIIYVPAESLQDYQDDPEWSSYMIQPIPSE